MKRPITAHLELLLSRTILASNCWFRLCCLRSIPSTSHGWLLLSLLYDALHLLSNGVQGQTRQRVLIVVTNITQEGLEIIPKMRKAPTHLR